MECNKEKNLENCTCSSDTCARKGICCECILYHKENGGMPDCLIK